MGGTFLRPAVLLAPLAIGLACWYACPGGADWSLARELLREQRRGEALDRREQAVGRCLEAKERVAAEVIAGGLPLAEAARRFGEIGEAAGDSGVGGARRVCGERGLCLNVLRWVAQGPAGSEWAAALARLEEEYRERFGAPPPQGRLLWQTDAEGNFPSGGPTP
jgi:hypothetical protein